MAIKYSPELAATSDLSGKSSEFKRRFFQSKNSGLGIDAKDTSTLNKRFSRVDKGRGLKNRWYGSGWQSWSHVLLHHDAKTANTQWAWPRKQLFPCHFPANRTRTDNIPAINIPQWNAFKYSRIKNITPSPASLLFQGEEQCTGTDLFLHLFERDG